MLTKAEKDSVEVAWDRFKNRNPNAVSTARHCCRNCNMGPCCIDPFGNGPDKVCGATADTIVARATCFASGRAAAHSDRTDIVETLRAAEGKAPDYEVKDKENCWRWQEFNVTDGRSEEIAAEIARRALDGLAPAR